MTMIIAINLIDSLHLNIKRMLFFGLKHLIYTKALV